MATTGPFFVRGANPIWFMVDLAAEPFDDTFYMWVVENTVPYLPAPVYHTPTGTPWTSPIQFLANGTLPVDIFFDPSRTYRLEFRHNLGFAPPSQTDPLIYLVEDYVPGAGDDTPSDVTGSITDNQITNGQFSIVNFADEFSLTSATNPDPIEVAPGWFLDLVGTGSVLIQKRPLNTTTPSPTNAPYALRINLTGGWTTFPVLRQRFQQNGQNWQGKHVAASLTALIATAPASIFTRLDASNGMTLALIMNPMLTNAFVEYKGTALIPAYTNLDVPPDAYLDYKIFLPLTGDIYITSLSLIASDSDDLFEYQQDTIDRQIDHTFHYYKPKLEYKEIPSYLIGWDFPLNPAQILGPTVGVFAGANQGQYAWDQTITYQTITNSVSVARGTSGGFQATCVANGQIAILQYLDQATARKILRDRVAVHMDASTTKAGGLSGTVSLWATDDATLSTLPTTPITALSADGVPTMGNGTWVRVPNLLQNDTFELGAAVTDQSGDVSLNGWDMEGAAIVNTATFFCMVVGFAPWLVGEAVTLNSIGMMAGDIATRPAPQKADEVLSNCRRFYEKSYAAATVPATITNVNMIAKAQGAYLEAGVAYRMVAQSFSIEYLVEKRTTAATIVLYNPATVTANQVLGTVFGKGSAAAGTGNIATSIWTPITNTKGAFFNLNGYNEAVTEGSFAGGGWASGAIRLHYVVDARLGVIN